MPRELDPVTNEFPLFYTDSAFDPAIVALTGGGFVQLWLQDVPGDGVYFRVFDAAGTAIKFGIARDEYGAHEPVITSLESGGFLIAWHEFSSPFGLEGRVYDASGTALGGSFQFDPDGKNVAVIDTAEGFAALIVTADDRLTFQNFTLGGALVGPRVNVGDAVAEGADPGLLRLTDGTLLATWTENEVGLRVAHIGSDGSLLSDSFSIPRAESISTLDGGGFVVVWTERGPSADAADIFAQRYQATGALLGEAFRVNELVAGDQQSPSITGMEGGGFAVSWTGQDADGTGIKARLFGQDGEPVESEFLVNTGPRESYDSPNQRSSEIIRLVDGGVLVSWFQINPTEDRFVGRIFASTQLHEGTSGNDVLTGTAYKDEMYGLAGDDVLHGLGSNDYLGGGDGTDVLHGGAGADWMQGAAGNDYMFIDNALDRALEDIGAGFDTAFTTVSFALEAGAEIEALRFVDSADTAPFDLTGNEFGQVLAGNAAGNVLRGNGGDDYLQGNGGNDYLDGGVGTDILIGGTGDDWYVLINEADRIIENEGEGRDTIFTTVEVTLQSDQSIEGLRAWDMMSTAMLTLRGNDLAQTIEGNAGANTLDGGGGADLMIGGAGDDFYIVDNAGDIIEEFEGRGYDVAFTSASYDLRGGRDVEELRISDTASTTAMNLWGNEFGQMLVGNNGENFLSASGGNDTIWALGGSDRLEGGAGDDILIGGAGEDVFGFSETGFRDRIADFVSGTDRIDLRAIDAVANDIFADNAFLWIGTNAFSGIAGQLRTYSEAGITYLAGDTTGDGGVDFLIDLGSAQVQSSDLLL